MCSAACACPSELARPIGPWRWILQHRQIAESRSSRSPRSLASARLDPVPCPCELEVSPGANRQHAEHDHEPAGDERGERAHIPEPERGKGRHGRRSDDQSQSRAADVAQHPVEAIPGARRRGESGRSLRLARRLQISVSADCRPLALPGSGTLTRCEPATHEIGSLATRTDGAAPHEDKVGGPHTPPAVGEAIKPQVIGPPETRFAWDTTVPARPWP